MNVISWLLRQMSWRPKWLLHFTDTAIMMTSRTVSWPETQTSKDVGSPIVGNGGIAARVLKLKLYNSYPGIQQWSSHTLSELSLSLKLVHPHQRDNWTTIFKSGQSSETKVSITNIKRYVLVFLFYRWGNWGEVICPNSVPKPRNKGLQSLLS